MSRRNLKTLLPPVLLLWGAASCSSQDASVRETVEEGVRTRTYHATYSPETNPLNVIPERLIGADQRVDTYLLTAPRPAAVGEDGTLFVVDARESVIYVFSPEGELLDRFGGYGSGPGEFLSLSTVLIDSPFLYCPDVMAGRLTILRQDGQFVGMKRASGIQALSGLRALLGSPDSREYLTYSERRKRLDAHSYELVRLNESLQDVETILSFPLLESPGWIRGVPLVPFTSEMPVLALNTGRPVAWYLGDSARIEFLNPISRERWVTVIPHPRIPIPKEVQEQVRANYGSQSDREEVRNMRFPELFPHFRSLTWDAIGRLWAQEYFDHTKEADVRKYYLFSEIGEWIAVQEVLSMAYFPGVALFTENGFYLPTRQEDGSLAIQFFRLVER
jgi:hypothetical protein